MNIPITRPWFDERERAAILEPLAAGWVVQGPKVEAFERGIAAFTGARAACATTSCTTALHLALHACGVGPGDEVIVPAFTFVATANVVEQLGARPVFVDVEPDTFNLDPARIPAVLTPRTRAIVPVHLFGLAADLDPILALARKRGLRVVEDAACAIGCFRGDRHVGTSGDAGCFSFHPRKSITTGEGGMVLTSDPELDRRIRVLRDHGGAVSDRARHAAGVPLLPDYDVCGFNFRMTDLQGALGLAQLDKLPVILERKRALADRYARLLSGLSWLRLPSTPPGDRHGWQAYVTLFAPEPPEKQDPAGIDRLHARRNRLMAGLQARGIATRQGTHAVHVLGYYARKYGLGAADFPNAWIADRLSLALPLYPQMTEAEQDAVVQALREAAP